MTGAAAVAGVGLAVAGAAGVAGTAAAVRLRRRLVVVTVDGPSMRPTLQEGERVLVRRTPLPALRRGQVVVVELPEFGGGWARPPPDGRRVAGRHWLIKRVAALPGDQVPAVLSAVRPGTRLPPSHRVPDGHLAVLGDNVQGSFDSRMFGFVPAARVLGVAVRTMR